MIKNRASHIAIIFTLISFSSSGCITSAGGKLSPVDNPIPAEPVSIQYLVGDFSFTLEGGKMITSNQAGGILGNSIFGTWKSRKYIKSFARAGKSGFSQNAEHRFTLSGSQYGDSSIVAQILSGLTLYVLPYSVDTKYDIQLVYENTRTGTRCSAEISDSYRRVTEILLILALPISEQGKNATLTAMGDHLYRQLHQECGFGV